MTMFTHAGSLTENITSSGGSTNVIDALVQGPYFEAPQEIYVGEENCVGLTNPPSGVLFYIVQLFGITINNSGISAGNLCFTVTAGS